MLSNIFSKEKVNTKRQIEIDLLRGFTALIVIICHVGLYLGNEANTGLYVFSDIIGSELAAPIFMALMGISVAYSRHNFPKDLLKRGIHLLILGYLLSLFRSILPLLILGNVDKWTSIDAFFVVDILQLAGLSFIFLSLLRKLKINNIFILLISLVMVFINQYIMLPETLPFNNKVLIGLVNLFTPLTTWSCFPFLTWFFFVAFGLFLGDIITHLINKDRFYLIFLILGFIGVFYVYYTFYKLYPNYTSYYWGNNYYYMGVKNVLLTCFFIMFGLSFWHFISKILSKFISKYLSYLSRNINVFYLISWIIISILMHIQAITGNTMSVLMNIITMIVVTVACSLLTYLYNKVKNKIKENKNK